MGYFVGMTRFEVEHCCANGCGVEFAMTADLMERRRKDHATFYCPNGHAQHYTGKTEEQKLREQNERLRRNLEAESGRAAMIAQERDDARRQNARMRTRIQNGVCPCCTRTFPNLAAHMKTKHPEFGAPMMFKTLREMFGLTQRAVADEIGVSPAYVSLFEREKPVPARAEKRLSEWVETNAKAKTDA